MNTRKYAVFNNGMFLGYMHQIAASYTRIPIGAYLKDTTDGLWFIRRDAKDEGNIYWKDLFEEEVPKEYVLMAMLL